MKPPGFQLIQFVGKLLYFYFLERERERFIRLLQRRIDASVITLQ